MDNSSGMDGDSFNNALRFKTLTYIYYHYAIYYTFKVNSNKFVTCDGEYISELRR